MDLEMNPDDFAYTTGGDQKLLHKRRLGSGAFGDVHEVTLSFNPSSDCFADV